MARIFISYRRDDAAGYAGWLHDRLEARLQPSTVFIDRIGLAPGTDWRKALEKSLSECDCFIAVIGPRWIAADGRNRFSDVSDVVRSEVSSALERAGRDELKFIPIFVDGAVLPRIQDLPEGLQVIDRYQSADVSLANFRQVTDEIIASLRQDEQGSKPAHIPPIAETTPLELITHQGEALEAFELFRHRISCGETVRVKIGSPGGTYEDDVFYHAVENIWCLPFKGTRDEGRFYIPFGWGRPDTKGINNMIVQFNPAHSGDNPRLGGLWLKDWSGKKFLGHTGRVGGGRPGIGKSQFKEFYRNGGWRTIQRKNGLDQALVFGPLGNEMNLNELSDFVKEVRDFKEQAGI